MVSALDKDPLAEMDKEMMAKCVFLDIEIAVNMEEDCSDIKVGEMYIRKASTYQMLMDDLSTRVVKFRSASEAFRFYVDHVGSGDFTWGAMHKT